MIWAHTAGRPPPGRDTALSMFGVLEAVFQARDIDLARAEAAVRRADNIEMVGAIWHVLPSSSVPLSHAGNSTDQSRKIPFAVSSRHVLRACSVDPGGKERVLFATETASVRCLSMGFPPPLTRAMLPPVLHLFLLC